MHELRDDRFGLQVIVAVVVVAFISHRAIEALHDAVRFGVARFGLDIDQVVRLDVLMTAATSRLTNSPP